jgi:hypothetical protein
MRYILHVVLNGTDVNPYHRWGLTQNPIPQLGVRQWDEQVLRVQGLAGEPIPSVEYIREKLDGMSIEFVELLCSKYVKGEVVEFDVSWEEDDL